MRVTRLSVGYLRASIMRALREAVPVATMASARPASHRLISSPRCSATAVTTRPAGHPSASDTLPGTIRAIIGQAWAVWTVTRETARRLAGETLRTNRIAPVVMRVISSPVHTKRSIVPGFPIRSASYGTAREAVTYMRIKRSRRSRRLAMPSTGFQMVVSSVSNALNSTATRQQEEWRK
jgi:hypothetical protein